MSVLLLGANYLGVIYFLEKSFPNALYGFHLFFLVLSAIIHKVLEKSVKGRSQQFITNFMGMLTMKMLLSMFLLLGYLYLHREHKVLVAINFFIIYISHTAFESVFLLKNSGNTPKQEKTV